MDVVCERCKAEYEFDDALVSERGTTVKCTSCGHQFKIYRPALGEGGRSSWHLRRPDGTIIPFDSLAVLQKWILEGRVSKVDEISRPGEPWKTLGAIAELESFFITAEQRAAAASVPPRGPAAPAGGTLRPPTPARGAPAALPRAPNALRAPSLPPVANAPNALRAPSLPPIPGAARGEAPEPARTVPSGTSAFPPPARTGGEAPPRASVSTVEGYAIDPAVGPPGAPRKIPSLPPPPDRSGPHDRPADRSGPHAPVAAPPPSLRPDDRSAPNQRPPTPSDRPRAAPAPALPSAPPDDDDSLPPVAPPTGPSRGVVAGLALGLAVAVALGGAAWQLGYLRGQPAASSAGPATGASPEVATAVATARRLAARATARAYEDAREALARALALAPDDGAALATRTQVVALSGELLRQQADDLEARARQAPAEAAALQAEAAVLRRNGAEQIDRARAELSRARDAVAALRGEARAVAEAALADAARITGDPSAAQRHVEASRLAGPSPEGDLAAALLARDGGTRRAAIEGLRGVVGRSGELLRARLALARLLASEGDAAAARGELDAVLRAESDHAEARSLLAAIAQGPPPVAVAPAPVAPVAVPPVAMPAAPVAPAPVAPAPAPAAPTDPNAPRRGVAPPAAGRSYAQLVEDGERLLRDRMEVTQARERFRAALAMRPDGCEAITGLGDVELEDRELSSAISYYRRATAACPSHGDAWVGLGQAYTSQQRYEQAIEAYTRYLNVNPGGAHAHMARQHIQQLRERVNGAASTPPGG